MTGWSRPPTGWVQVTMSDFLLHSQAVVLSRGAVPPDAPNGLPLIMITEQGKSVDFYVAHTISSSGTTRTIRKRFAHWLTTWRTRQREQFLIEQQVFRYRLMKREE